MKRALAICVCVVAAFAAASPAQAPLAEGDRRVGVVTWSDGAEVGLRTSIGSPLSVIFDPDEQIQSVVVGDPSTITVNVAPQRDSLTILASRMPADPLLVIRGKSREYRFRIVIGPQNDVVYALRLHGTPVAQTPLDAALPPPELRNRFEYRLKGQDGLRPARVSDDGTHTYIEWADDQPLPAVFAVNHLGDEETVDSYMRSGITVIDRVYPRLIFRMGKHSAEAIRQDDTKKAARS